MSENFEHRPQPPSEQPGAEKNPEQELSPEIIEKIMEKVQDIEAKGTAFTVIDPEGFDSVLDNGLLGQDPFSRGKRPTKKDWIESRKTSHGLVHFNIVGRSYNPFMRGSPTSLKESYHVQGQRAEYVFLFDISHFEEYPPIPKEEIQETERKKTYSPRTFRAVFEFGYQDLVKRFGEPLPMPDSHVIRDAIAKDPDGFGRRFDQNGLLRVDSEFGFVLSFRVSPRYFTGLVIKLPEGVTNQQQLQEKVEKTTTVMRQHFQAKEDLLLPLYDLSGNLRWPMKMSYDEVKKFVATREQHKPIPDNPDEPDKPLPE